MLIVLSACNEQIADSVEINQPAHMQENESEIHNLTEIASLFEFIPLYDSDFEVLYNGFTIRHDTTPDCFQNSLGYPEDFYWNNRGNISNGNGYRRWQLSYPDYLDTDIRIIFMSVQELDDDGNEFHGDTYMVGISIMNTETQRGLRRGDSIDRVFDLYGQPTAILKYHAIPHLNMLVYEHENKQLEIVLDETNSIVRFIFINYRMEQSIIDQGLL
jgi:hypothetical protein